MVQIPTTERKYYNVTPKVNTLEAYAKALQPAVNQLQSAFKEQQSIKIDSLSTDARIKMNEATEQWRLANQSNPNNPEALKDIETQYNNILNEYRNQIDPIYRKNWDLTANKLRGAYSLQNQTWGIEQNKKNVTFDIQNAIKNNFSMAQGYGMNGQFTEALADYSASYEKLLDYGAKNLGTETAAQLLIDYRSNYVKSYLSGVMDRNPDEVLTELEKDDIKSSLNIGDYNTIKSQAENKKYDIFNKNKRNSVIDFAINPTQENYENWLMYNPDASEDKKLAMQDRIKTGLQYVSFSGYGSYDDAEKVLDNISKMPNETDEDVNKMYNEAAEFVDKMDYSYKTSDKDRAFSKDNRDKLANVTYRMLADNTFKENYLKLIPKQIDRDSSFKLFLKHIYSFPHEKAMIDERRAKQIKAMSSQQAINALVQGDFDGANQALYDGNKKLINLRYDGIADWDKLEKLYNQGKPALFEYNGVTYRFNGYGSSDIFVEEVK